MDDLAGKVVLITGASSGIGAAAARAFSRQGARVVVHYNKSKIQAEAVALELRQAGGEVLIVGGDVTSPGVPAQIVEEAVKRSKLNPKLGRKQIEKIWHRRGLKKEHHEFSMLHGLWRMDEISGIERT